jgi:hypothetical protein
MFILLSVCLLTSPSTCREERISWNVDGAGGMACLVRAQELIAQWHETHQRWRVSSWRCATRSALQDSI